MAGPGVVLGPPQETTTEGSSNLLVPAGIGSMWGFAGAPAVNSALEVVAVHCAKIAETNDMFDRGLAFMVALPVMKQFLQGGDGGA